MIKPQPYTTKEVVFDCEYGRSYVAEEVLSTAFALDDEKMQIFVNYNTEEKTIEFNGLFHTSVFYHILGRLSSF